MMHYEPIRVSQPLRFDELTIHQQLTIALAGRCRTTDFQTICNNAKMSPFDRSSWYVADKLFGNHPDSQLNIEGGQCSGSLYKNVEGDKVVYHLYWSGRDDAIVLRK